MDTELAFPRERDGWVMQGFMALGYTGAQLKILNRVWLHQQVVFMSCVPNTYGSALDEKYLKRRPDHQQWSTLKFPTERPPSSDFKLWQEALWQLVPAEGMAVRLGCSLHKGYKIWDWRVSTKEGYLVHNRGEAMDFYQLVPHLRRRWQLMQADCTVEEVGIPCSVHTIGDGNMITTSVSPTVDEVIPPQMILEVIRSWKQTWFWRKLRSIGQMDWLWESLEAGTVLALADGSYIKELFTDASSCAFVLECQEGRGRILGRIIEGSKDSC